MTSTHGKCPLCKKSFKVTNPTFARQIPKTPITFVYALCNSCESKFSSANWEAREKIASKSHKNILADQTAEWACTTSFALNYHGDFLKAFQEGLILPSYLVDAMVQGLVSEVGFIRSSLGDENVKS